MATVTMLDPTEVI